MSLENHRNYNVRQQYFIWCLTYSKAWCNCSLTHPVYITSINHGWTFRHHYSPNNTSEGLVKSMFTIQMIPNAIQHIIMCYCWYSSSNRFDAIQIKFWKTSLCNTLERISFLHDHYLYNKHSFLFDQDISSMVNIQTKMLFALIWSQILPFFLMKY